MHIKSMERIATICYEQLLWKYPHVPLWRKVSCYNPISLLVALSLFTEILAATNIAIQSERRNFTLVKDKQFAQFLVDRAKVIVLNVKYVERVGHFVIPRHLSRERVVAQDNGLHPARAETCPLLWKGATKVVVVQVQDAKIDQDVVTFHPVVWDGAGKRVVTQIHVVKFAKIQVWWNGTRKMVVVHTEPSCGEKAKVN